MNNDMRTHCIEGFEWPEALKNDSWLLTPADFGNIGSAIKSFDKSEPTIVSILSREYLTIAKSWIAFMEKNKIKQYVIVTVDKEVAEYLVSADIPHHFINTTRFSDRKSSFQSKTGFSEKGLCLTSLKFPVTLFLLRQGYNTFLVDIDAFLLRELPEKRFLEVDIAFQRVVYFPAGIAERWGFAACSGFIWFQSNQNTIKVVERAIEMQKLTYDDQIAFNLAIWECNIEWHGLHPAYKLQKHTGPAERKSIFQSQSNKNIDGVGDEQIKVRALSPELYWRNDIIKLDLSRTILFHPNSGKDEASKLSMAIQYKILSISEITNDNYQH